MYCRVRIANKKRIYESAYGHSDRSGGIFKMKSRSSEYKDLSTSVEMTSV